MIVLYLSKLAAQGLVNIKSVTIGNEVGCEVISVESAGLLNLYKEFLNENMCDVKEALKRKCM